MAAWNFQLKSWDQRTLLRESGSDEGMYNCWRKGRKGQSTFGQLGRIG
jgi:hypothetical protein